MASLFSNRRATKEQAIKSHLVTKLSFAIFIVSITIFGYGIWTLWPMLMTTGMQWQKQINSELSELLYAAKHEGLMAGMSLMVMSFLYGILHSVGPGHGKLIVTTYIATQDAKVKLSLIITLVSSLMQALVAVGLVSVLLMLFDASMRDINHKAELLIPLSFYTAILLGVVIIWRNLVLMYRVVKDNEKVIKSHDIGVIQRLTPLSHASSNSYNNVQKSVQTNTHKAAFTASVSADHVHDDKCGCGHQHVVSSEQINDASSMKEYLAIILSIGIRPCTGAIMVLLFANMLDIYWLGIVSAVVMALGTALTTSTIAIMTITGKQVVRRYLSAGKQRKTPSNQVSISKFIVPIVGGLVLILLGVLLLESRPVGMSPMF
ncbi:nickel/cobalt transporter [Moritella sp. F3]|uniref:nickel/cobalt transporter n=1 Tax=Moritella sp. F3 TaxID=2718882 RepID=UPI0018E1D15F|nr:nickel/cobalt transporter [Moritella sp. F3]GIC78132.1 putative nickel/cobalt efflux system [Moritella sp. F1]GIC83669.1 putative nickel/cobalt efflux system [Moritella sp. F3]